MKTIPITINKYATRNFEVLFIVSIIINMVSKKADYDYLFILNIIFFNNDRIWYLSIFVKPMKNTNTKPNTNDTEIIPNP